MSAMSETYAADGDWPGTYDLCRSALGWELTSHTCENPVCWCFDDPPELRCGWAEERARAELVSVLRREGENAEADRVEHLPIADVLGGRFGSVSPWAIAPRPQP
jgi:hypothetical protein